MAAVVDHDVDLPHLVHDRIEEPGVGLVTDEDLDPRPAVLLARWIHVEPDDPRTRAEVVAPHLQRASAEDADLEQRDGFPPEAAQVTVVRVGVAVELHKALPAVGPQCRPYVHRVETLVPAPRR